MDFKESTETSSWLPSLITWLQASQWSNKPAIYTYSLHFEKERGIFVFRGNLRRQKVTICVKNVIESPKLKFLPHQESARNSLITLRSCRLSLRFMVFLRDSVSWSSLHISAQGCSWEEAGGETCHLQNHKPHLLPHGNVPGKFILLPCCVHKLFGWYQKIPAPSAMRKHFSPVRTLGNMSLDSGHLNWGMFSVNFADNLDNRPVEHRNPRTLARFGLFCYKSISNMEVWIWSMLHKSQ